MNADRHIADHCSSSSTLRADITSDTSTRRRNDDGGILPMALLFIAFAALISIPLLNYAVSVLDAGQVQSDKSEGVEYARGGTYIALSHETDLYDMCVGGELPSSLEDVTVECDVLEIEQLRPIEEVPYHVATVLADTQVPTALATGDEYVNPNTAGDPAAWITAGDTSEVSEQDKVWLPQLPVQSTSSGDTRDTQMAAGTWDIGYSSCRVLFPGTFDVPLTFDSPTYLVSGVYYFADAVTLLPGADVVVGDGAAVGCTTDFEAVASAIDVPDPLNVSGLGGTIVLGGEGRIEVDDSTGSGDVRFVVNRRYVSPDETSVLASEDVSIISVNGAHEPLLTGETAGDALSVPGLNYVPASTVGTDGSPLAVSEGYEASVHTYRPGVPDAPTSVTVEGYQQGVSTSDGRVVVTWDEPAHNGSRITGYVASDQWGNQCSPATPTAPDYTIQLACTIAAGYSDGSQPQVAVVAVNGVGTSDPSASVTLASSISSSTPVYSRPSQPLNLVAANMYSDGMEVSWDAPASPGELPISGYRVLIEDALFGGTIASCDAWFDETSCFVPLGAGDGPLLDIIVEPFQIEGDPATEVLGGSSAVVSVNWTPGTSAAPADPVVPTLDVAPTPILDFASESASSVMVSVDGYIAVPQGMVSIGAVTPAFSSVQLNGGVLAAYIELDAGGASPATTVVEFDNPEAQKQIRVRSSYDGGRVPVVSEAVVQINRSGSIGINSWIVGADGTAGSSSGGSDDGGSDGGGSDGGSSDGGGSDGGSTDGGSTDGGSTDGGGTTTPDPGSFDPFDYCGSGYSVWLNDFGTGQWLAEYWNFDGSVDPKVDFGAAVFAGTPDGSENVAVIDRAWASNNGPAGQNGLYATRHSTTIDLVADCEFNFKVGGDDGYALYVDGNRIAAKWSDGGTTDVEVTYTLTAGQHTLVVDHYDAGGTAAVNLDWSVADLPDPTIGSFSTLDHCASGQADYTSDFGTGQWLAEYFEFDSSTGWNDYGSAIFAQTRTSYEYLSEIAASWNSTSSPTGQNDYFAARYTATVELAADCEITFKVRGDDGYALYIDDVLQTDDWGSHSPTEKEVTVSLTAGQHTFRLDFFEHVSSAEVSLEWKVDVVDDYTGTTHPTIVGDSGNPIGNFPEEDYCASGQTNWTTDWGEGTFLAEYWNFNSSTDTGDLGADIFVGSPDGTAEYVSDLYRDWGSSGGPAGQGSYFGTRHTATINVPAGCTMQVAPAGNNGYALYINDTLMTSYWSNPGYSYNIETVTLPAGQHLIVLDHYEVIGQASIALWWKLSS